MSCIKEDSSDAPVADFIVDKVVVEAGEQLEFSCISLNDPLVRDWKFQNGEPSTATGNKVQVKWDKPGVYDVELTVTNKAGTDTKVIEDCIVVEKMNLEIVFQNKTPSNVEVNYEIDADMKTVYLAPDEKFVLDSLEKDESIFTLIYAYGIDEAGEQRGELLSWSNNVRIVKDELVDISVSKDYFFLELKNNGDSCLSNLCVNYGLANQMNEQISIPADNIRYPIGYYEAFINTEIKMDEVLTGDEIIWTQGVDFKLAWKENQRVLINHSCKSKTNQLQENGRASANLNVQNSGNYKDPIQAILN
jgi:PKD repeat protein